MLCIKEESPKFDIILKMGYQYLILLDMVLKCIHHQQDSKLVWGEIGRMYILVHLFWNVHFLKTVIFAQIMKIGQLQFMVLWHSWYYDQYDGMIGMIPVIPFNQSYKECHCRAFLLGLQWHSWYDWSDGMIGIIPITLLYWSYQECHSARICNLPNF